MNANLWVLLSEKSFPSEPVIKALTGMDGEGYFDLMLASSQTLHMWTQTSAINDSADAPDAKAWTQSWLDYMTEWGTHLRYNGLAGFHLDADLDAEHSAQAYLEAFAKAGGRIESIVTLGEETPEWARALGTPFAALGDMPTNALADRIRRMWEWR